MALQPAEPSLRQMASRMGKVFEPLMRTTARAPPVGVAKAQMVSVFISLHKHEIHGGHEAQESSKMVPLEAFVLEHHVGNDGKDYQ